MGNVVVTKSIVGSVRIQSKMNSVRMVHIPRFRSTRAVWMFQELKALYGGSMPDLEITSFSDIPSFRANKPQWLLDMNPNGTVPSMSYGDIVMFEGGAICSFFLHCFDKENKILPKDPAGVALYYQMVSWSASTVDNLTATSSALNIVLDKSLPRPRPMDDVATNQKYFDEIYTPFLLKVLTKSKGEYLYGESFSAADVIVGYTLITAAEKMVPAWISPDVHPEIYRYYQVLRARSGFQFAISPVV